MSLLRWPILLPPATVDWQQNRQFVEQVSLWTGRSRVARWGPASRWTAEVTFPPLDASTLRVFRYFAGELGNGKYTYLPVVEGSQYGASENLVTDPFRLVTGWSFSSPLREPAIFHMIAFWAPSPQNVLTSATPGVKTATANGGVSVLLGSPLPAQLYISCWGLTAGGATGTASLRVEWRDSSDTLLSTAILNMDPGNAPFTTPTTWHRVQTVATRPGSADRVRIFLLCEITAGRMVWAHPRVSVFPEFIEATTSTPTVINGTGAQPSRPGVSRADMLSIQFPSGQVQTAVIDIATSDGSGNFAAQLTEPIRQSPPAGTRIHLARPFVALRGPTNVLSWSAQRMGVYETTMSLSEAF
jgi:hypothetical protein